MSNKVVETIAVSVVVERRPARNPWQKHVWQPVDLRPGAADMADWTVIGEVGDRLHYHAGSAEVMFHSGDTKVYRDNLQGAAPSVYVVLRKDGAGWRLHLVTVDPTEAHAHADVGDDLVEALPMPLPIQARLQAFVARHHVEQREWKRRRDRADPEALAARPTQRAAREPEVGDAG